MKPSRSISPPPLWLLLALGLVAAAGVAAGLLSAPDRAGAAFPGANGQIAFRSQRDGNEEVYVMNADGSSQVNRTNNTADDELPAWSPDGAKIAFDSDPVGNSEIYAMNADGTGQVNRTNNTAAEGEPAWSPDGAKIAFVSDRDGNLEIYVMNADGTGQTRLTNNPANDLHPSFSPDGTKIAFASLRDGNYEIYVMNADGVGQTRLTNNLAYDADPAFFPDGTKIAFTSSRDGNYEIYAMNADGLGQTRLTDNPTYDAEPALSPDGTKIAFTSHRDGNYEIYAMNADGLGQTRLTNNAASDDNPDWGVASSTTVPAFGPRTLVTLSLAAKRIPALGPFKVRVTNANSFLVTGRLSGQTDNRVSVSHKRGVELKAKSLRVAARTKKTVKMRLPKVLQRLLKRKGKLKLRLTAKVNDPAGNTRNVNKRVTPKLKKKGRR